MAWPQATDYNGAVQNPGLCFDDPDLRTGQLATDLFGLPRPHSGNFADVYQVTGRDGRAWAVKCFTRPVSGLQERYQAISAHLFQTRRPFMVDFRFLPQGIRIHGYWYPILKMSWVEGQRLNEFVAEQLDRPVVFERLAPMFLRLGQELREAGMAHGDLQHGNVLLVPTSKTGSLALRLIDYDGLYVPSLALQPSGEIGHPHYQHPQRLREGFYHPDMDRFSLLLISTALRALTVAGKALWERYDNGENLLFREADFRIPSSSPLLRELWALPDARARSLVGHLLLSSRGPVAAVPALESLVAESGEVRPLTVAHTVEVRALLGLSRPVRSASQALPKTPEFLPRVAPAVAVEPLTLAAAPSKSAPRRERPAARLKGVSASGSARAARTAWPAESPRRRWWPLWAGVAGAALLAVGLLVVAWHRPAAPALDTGASQGTDSGRARVEGDGQPGTLLRPTEPQRNSPRPTQDPPLGYEALLRLDRLPLLADWQAYQASSYDRIGGKDASHFLRTEANGEDVLVDTDGPGVVTRLWSTGAVGRPNVEQARFFFYFDGEVKPSLVRSPAELFGGPGSKYPFVPPLSATFSAGAPGNPFEGPAQLCYTPIPFRKHLKITARYTPFYHVDYLKVPADREVLSWTPEWAETQRPQHQQAAALFETSGKDPKPTAANTQSKRLAETLPVGGNLSLKLDGPAVIDALWVKLAAPQPRLLRDVLLHYLRQRRRPECADTTRRFLRLRWRRPTLQGLDGRDDRAGLLRLLADAVRPPGQRRIGQRRDRPGTGRAVGGGVPPRPGTTRQHGIFPRPLRTEY